MFDVRNFHANSPLDSGGMTFDNGQELANACRENLMKQKLIPIVSVLIGILAFWLTYQYLRGEQAKLAKKEREMYENAQKIRIVAAAHDLPSGTVIKPGDIGAITVFKSGVAGQAVLDGEEQMLYGRKLLFKVNTKEPVFWSHVEGGAASAAGLAPIIKPGMRALSLAVSGADAVSGMIQPNNRIDILGTFSFPSKEAPGEMETVTLTVLQDVTVLAAGQTLAKDQSSAQAGRGGSGTITVEVTPRETELLVFAQQMKGRLTLTLRNAQDVSYETDLPQINFTRVQSAIPELNEYRQTNILRKRSLR
jgi:pilus assembly protein CpaB